MSFQCIQDLEIVINKLPCQILNSIPTAFPKF